MKFQLSRVVLGTLFVLVFVGAAGAIPSVIGDDLAPVLRDAADAEKLPVVVLMNPRHDVQELSAYVEGLRGAERKAVMWQEVSYRADQAQAQILDELYAFEQTGDVDRIRSLKMANAVAVEATPAVIQEMAAREDVFAIHYTPDRQVIPDSPEITPADINELDELAWGVATVNADDAWNLGYTGEGIIVAVIDTGCNYNHVDLADHLWDGGPSYPNHGYDFYNNDNNPLDDNGHGTHVAGTVLGDGTAGTETGVAPDATLMAVKIFSAGGNGNEATCWESLDFCLAQGAHITSMSAGWHNVADNIKSTFRANYDILNAAGIVSIVAAGNEGDWQSFYPIPNNVRTPGNVPAPWQHPDQTEPGAPGGVITAGATDINDNIASFSSRGPVTWETVSPFNDFVYSGGASQGLIKPDLSAPGVNVMSLNYSTNTGYTDSYSGTSMATPHISGAAAVLLSMDDGLLPEQIGEVLELGSLELGAAGKDNTFGSGRLDVYESVLLAEGMLTDISIYLTPLFDEPYFIPSNGGNLVFDAMIRNNYAVPTPGHIWTSATLPNGNEYPINTYNITFQPGVDIQVNGAQQNVPGFAPSGYYEYVVKAGPDPNNIVDVESFTFVKFGWEPEDAGNSDWTLTGFDVEQTAKVASADQPDQFTLGKAFPNPFNPTTTISLALPTSGQVEVAVYNALGRQVATLHQGALVAGNHSFTFDASSMSSGVYFIRASAGANTAMQKVVLMK